MQNLSNIFQSADFLVQSLKAFSAIIASTYISVYRYKIFKFIFIRFFNLVMSIDCEVASNLYIGEKRRYLQKGAGLRKYIINSYFTTGISDEIRGFGQKSISKEPPSVRKHYIKTYIVYRWIKLDNNR